MSESGEREKGETTAKTTEVPADRVGDKSRVGDSEITLPRVPTSALIAKALPAPPIPQYPPSVQLATGVSGTIPAPVRGASGPAASQGGIELGRPLYAVSALAVLVSLATLAIAGKTVAFGVAVGGTIATM